MDKDIIDAFREESRSLLEELSRLISSLEEASGQFPLATMNEFSQKIDRIMGAAKTLTVEDPDHKGLERIGRIAELCKILGVKASEEKSLAILPLFSAFWADTIEVIGELLDHIEDSKGSERISQEFSAILQGRLEWLAKRMKGEKASAPALDVEKLLKQLGL